MSTQTGLVTVEEFLKLPPATGGHFELHHGEVVLVPPPKWGHRLLQRTIELLLLRLVGHAGEVLQEMPFRPRAEHEVWAADVGFVRAERAAVGRDEYLQGAPDLVVEVLSPSNTAREINAKIAICMENGCSSFWVVDPELQRISVPKGDVTRHYGISATFHCDVLGGATPVGEIFE